MRACVRACVYVCVCVCVVEGGKGTEWETVRCSRAKVYGN